MTPNDVSVWLDALAGSHDRLCDLVSELDDEALLAPSYCDDWTIAQVLSHIGSGAEIFGKTVDAVVAGEPPPPREAYPEIWRRWDAMSPPALRESSLATDGELVEKLEHLGDALCDLEFLMFGALRVDAVGLLGMRLGEHALHTWDIAVALDPGALLDHDAATLIVSRLPVAVERLAKPDRADVDRPFTVRVELSDGARTFDLEIADGVSMSSSEPEAGAEGSRTLRLPTEAFVRLVYGRLDADHAADVAPEDPATLDTLRLVFPGF